MIEYGWSMWRTAASVEQLAQEMFEELVGFDPELGRYGPDKFQDGEASPGGYKPPRPDIAKLKEYRDLAEKARLAPGRPGDLRPKEVLQENWDAKEQWEGMTGLDADENEMGRVYNWCVSTVTYDENNKPHRDPFQFAVDIASGKESGWNKMMYNALGGTGSYSDFSQLEAPYPEDDAKNILANAIRKNQVKEAPRRYDDIVSLLRGLLRSAPETYKLWPWAVKQIKNNGGDPRIGNSSGYSPSHILDIVSDAGKEINRMRQENQLPPNFDINQMDLRQFEDWWMDWKREHRTAESEGEIVYKFSDDWTVQKLTTPEQLQFEGDEMGHCVGGYAHEVGSGSTIIYSLRDPRGMPHVTMEVEAQDGAKYFEDAGKSMVDFVHPDQHEPGEHTQYKKDHSSDDPDADFVKSGDEPFNIVQIQGNANNTPKPEYQRRIKEFLDALRAKGWELEWHPDGQWNDPERGRREQEIWDQGALTNWYEDFKSRPANYFGGSADEYGLPVRPLEVSGENPEELIEETAQLLLNAPNRAWEPEEHAREAYYYISHLYRPGSDEEATRYAQKLIENIFHKRDEYEEAAEIDQQRSGWPGAPYDEELSGEDNQERQDQAEREYYREAGYQRVFDYFDYLSRLLAHYGIPKSTSLPHTDNDHTFTDAAGNPTVAQGLPHPDSLQDKPWPQNPGNPFPPDSRSEVNPGGPEIPGTFSSWHQAEVGEEYESDPDFLYVFYGSELHVEPYEVNLKYEKLLEQLFDHFQVDMNNIVLDIDPMEVDAGEIRTSGPEVFILHKQLNDAKIREQAERAIRDWWEQERPKSKLFDWYELEQWQAYD